MYNLEILCRMSRGPTPPGGESVGSDSPLVLRTGCASTRCESDRKSYCQAISISNLPLMVVGNSLQTGRRERGKIYSPSSLVLLPITGLSNPCAMTHHHQSIGGLRSGTNTTAFLDIPDVYAEFGEKLKKLSWLCMYYICNITDRASLT